MREGLDFVDRLRRRRLSTEQKGKLTAGFGASTDEIGPEFTFGIYMEKLLGEPILIIKTSWGGRSLHTDFRPPSAGPYVWSDYELAQCKQRGDDLEKDKADKIKATGVFYRHMIEHVRKVLADIKRVVPEYDPKQGYELAGFVWFQGFNDLVSDWTYDKADAARRVRPVRATAGAFHPRCAQGSVGAEDALRDWSHGDWWREGREEAAARCTSARPRPRRRRFLSSRATWWRCRRRPTGTTIWTRCKSGWSNLAVDKMDARGQEESEADRAEKDEARKKAMAENFTPEEWKRLKGASNGGYHYLGAAKIMAPIGKAFAEAMAKLQATQ